MNQYEFARLVEQTNQATSGLLIAKGAEYAGTLDRLSNFKRASAHTGVTPLQVAFVYASKHYDSIATFIRADAAGFDHITTEPIDGRFHDLINYCHLMLAILEEQRAAKLAASES